MNVSYHRLEVKDVTYIRFDYNVADALTKVKQKSIFQELLQSVHLDHPVDQRVIRDTECLNGAFVV